MSQHRNDKGLCVKNQRVGLHVFFFFFRNVSIHTRNTLTCTHTHPHIHTYHTPIHPYMRAYKPIQITRLWLLGFSLFLVGAGLNAIGYPGVPEAMGAMLLVTQIVWNALFCFLVLKEKPTFWDYVGIVMILAGSALCLTFGPVNPHPCEHFDMPLVSKYFSGPSYIALAIIQVAVLCVIVGVQVLRWRRKEKPSALAYAIAWAIIAAYAQTMNKVTFSFIFDGRLTGAVPWLIAVSTFITAMLEVSITICVNTYLLHQSKSIIILTLRILSYAIDLLVSHCLRLTTPPYLKTWSKRKPYVDPFTKLDASCW